MPTLRCLRCRTRLRLRVLRELRGEKAHGALIGAVRAKREFPLPFVASRISRSPSLPCRLSRRVGWFNRSKPREQRRDSILRSLRCLLFDLVFRGSRHHHEDTRPSAASDAWQASGGIMARLQVPLSALRPRPHEQPCMTRGRGGSLHLPRIDLSSTTPHQSPGAFWMSPLLTLLGDRLARSRGVDREA